MPWGVAAAAVGVAGAVYGAKKTGEAAEEAAAGQQEASEAAIARSGEAFAMGEAELQPFARQEAAASSQMMSQLGIAPPAGGGAAAGGA